MNRYRAKQPITHSTPNNTDTDRSSSSTPEGATQAMSATGRRTRSAEAARNARVDNRRHNQSADSRSPSKPSKGTDGKSPARTSKGPASKEDNTRPRLTKRPRQDQDESVDKEITFKHSANNMDTSSANDLTLVSNAGGQATQTPPDATSSPRRPMISSSHFDPPPNAIQITSPRHNNNNGENLRPAPAACTTNQQHIAAAQPNPSAGQQATLDDSNELGFTLSPSRHNHVSNTHDNSHTYLKRPIHNPAVDTSSSQPINYRVHDNSLCQPINYHALNTSHSISQHTLQDSNSNMAHIIPPPQSIPLSGIPQRMLAPTHRKNVQTQISPAHSPLLDRTPTESEIEFALSDDNHIDSIRQRRPDDRHDPHDHTTLIPEISVMNKVYEKCAQLRAEINTIKTDLSELQITHEVAIKSVTDNIPYQVQAIATEISRIASNEQNNQCYDRIMQLQQNIKKVIDNSTQSMTRSNEQIANALTRIERDIGHMDTQMKEEMVNLERRMLKTIQEESLQWKNRSLRLEHAINEKTAELHTRADLLQTEVDRLNTVNPNATNTTRDSTSSLSDKHSKHNKSSRRKKRRNTSPPSSSPSSSDSSSNNNSSDSDDQSIAALSSASSHGSRYRQKARLPATKLSRFHGRTGESYENWAEETTKKFARMNLDDKDMADYVADYLHEHAKCTYNSLSPRKKIVLRPFLKS